MPILTDLVDRCAERGDRPAVIASRRTMSWIELADGARRLATRLRDAGVRPQDRIAYLGPSDPVWLQFELASAWVGAVATTLNWRLSPRELAAILAHARAVHLVADADMLATIEPALTHRPAGVTRFGPGTRFEADLDETLPDSAATPGGPGDVALQIYTSGTTGEAKGVMLTNEAVDVFLTEGARSFRLDDTSRGLYTLPLFHVAGGGFALLNAVGGSTGVVPDATGPEALMSHIGRHRITHTGMVPTVMQAIVDHPERSAHDLSSLRLVIYGAAPITPALLSRTLASIGPVFMHTYGLTEASGFVTVLEPEEHDATIPGRLLSCGRAVPWADLRIASIETGETLGPGARGEIQVRSPTLMTGYFESPDATAAAFTADGYLRTGDIGLIDDDGYVFVVDRLKDLIITGGENVSPVEVEAVLAAHPDVAQVAVVGVPHDRWGETVAAVVMPRTGATLDTAELITFARARLAHFKCPTTVDVVDELPTNATGKLDRRALRSRYGELR